MVQQNGEKKKLISLSSDTAYAKPRHDLVYKFGKGELKISGSTMDFMMYLSPFVDVDGRITISLENARQALYMQAKTYLSVREQARQEGLLYLKNGEYYSNFHIPVASDVRGLQYQKLVSEYTSATVLEYSLNLKRLFYYFASFTRMGTKKKVSIENLYKNTLHTDQFGISYFDTFSELADGILTLIKNDQIRVQLMVDEERNFGPTLTSETNDLEQVFLSFFDSKNGKKERTSNLKSKRHKIKVEMTDRVINNEVRVIASETEIKVFCDVHGIPWEELSLETKNYLFAYKNELFQLVGETGLAIYRSSIQKYLKENADSVLYHDLVVNKAANYVMDFYILPEVKNMLVGAALHPSVMIGNRIAEQVVLNGHLIDTPKIENLLQYYLKRASANHIVQLDSLLNINRIDYTEFKMSKRFWQILHDDALEIYSERYSDFKDIMDVFEWKKLCLEWADRGLLTNKKSFNKTIDDLKNNVFLLSKYRRRFVAEKDITTERVEPVKFYNWLEIRE